MAMKEITYALALNEAMSEEMRRDENVFFMGEDIGVYAGAFGVSKGMIQEFGPERVMDTPISETAYIGAGIGAAITGMRPIVELMFSDFMAVCYDQIINQAAKMRYMFGAKVKMPLVIRTAHGGGTGAAGVHRADRRDAVLDAAGRVRIDFRRQGAMQVGGGDDQAQRQQRQEADHHGESLEEFEVVIAHESTLGPRQTEPQLAPKYKQKPVRTHPRPLRGARAPGSGARPPSARGRSPAQCRHACTTPPGSTSASTIPTRWRCWPASWRSRCARPRTRPRRWPRTWC